MDRDLNVAMNLEGVAASWEETLNACGEESAGLPLSLAGGIGLGEA